MSRAAILLKMEGAAYLSESDDSSLSYVYILTLPF